MSGYAVQIGPSARKEITKLPPTAQIRIVKCLDGLVTNPRPSGVEKICQAPRFWRVRAGDYRVVYHIDEEARTVIVVVVRHRKDAYRDVGKLDARLVVAKLVPLFQESNRPPPGQ